MAELGAVELSDLTRGLSDAQKMIFQTQYSSEKKDRGTALILAMLGWDRFWLGDVALGLIKYITMGGCLIWWLVDLFTAGSRCDEYNRGKAREIAGSIRALD